MLQPQSSRKINRRQACHEIVEKSSEIVPLGAPLFSITYEIHIISNKLFVRHQSKMSAMSTTRGQRGRG